MTLAQSIKGMGYVLCITNYIITQSEGIKNRDCVLRGVAFSQEQIHF